MRSDQAYIADMLAAATDAEIFVARFTDAEQFARSQEPKWAVLQRLTVIGEAAGHVSNGTRQANPQIQWAVAKAMRNMIVHVYYDIDWRIVWETAIRDVPVLRRQLEELYLREFGDAP
jgi:uncharacterized protein with HEPN domain